MILGANQPYFLPYLCYFQLINAVDKFLLANNFQYIRHGWINRNRILTYGKIIYLSIPLIHATPNKSINELYVCDNPKPQLHSVKTAYAKAPYYDSVFPMIESMLYFHDRNLSAFTFNSLRMVCDYLGITTPLILNSERGNNTELRGEDRVIHLCHAMGADTYINAIGGQRLYSRERFAAAGINLKFLHGELPEYKQVRTQTFVPALSILDVMMNVPRDEIRQMLNQYTLV